MVFSVSVKRLERENLWFNSHSVKNHLKYKTRPFRTRFLPGGEGGIRTRG